jgi:hypothetical protein
VSCHTVRVLCQSTCTSNPAAEAINKKEVVERGAGYLLDSTPEYLEAGRKKVKDECEGMLSTLKQLRS